MERMKRLKKKFVLVLILGITVYFVLTFLSGLDNLREPWSTTTSS